MMIRNILIFFTIAIVLTGCFRKVPISYTCENYKKSGATELEVKKAMLECGYESPLGDSRNDANNAVIMDRCMEKNGFSDEWYLDYTHGKTFCEDYPTIPACFLPLDQIPDRNVTKRLNSKWCKHKLYRTYPECQP
jgi:hypothetical protein